ncbi:UDP-N-acetylglucosamine 2-epimerase (hydrolyzing) [Rhodopseudomonas palustris]|uniref:UDP-N-acetylglucosamine 2-epimerase (Hydrolyzing) n=1 Tax=Rhodopseudomonas palustris TaxID=1076 RepID=A0AAX3E0K2_RHOPL|nr:UDP-N-acetylglucosamine 2-epimerase [Rhodopseudomonas palustris]UYO40499.1 UDP-N-acetylglucosamine 2-epimerase (hydrolyzing) [Rhodopseudomonas palustris]
MRRLLIATAGRSDYGIYRPILDRIEAEPELDYALLVTGQHLSDAGGGTVEEIEADGRPIAARVRLPETAASRGAVAEAMAVALSETGVLLAGEGFDMVVVLGDRFEIFAVTAACVPFNIPVAHIHGGEVSFGAIDDSLRHAMTKMAHLHFAATDDYARRIRQLGEEDWRITVSGAPALDTMMKAELPDRATLSARFDLPLDEPPLMVTFHPVTRQFGEAERQTRALLTALEAVNLPVVLTAPNADVESDVIRRLFDAFLARRAGRAWLVESFGALNYLAMLREARAAVGNSSSGLIETPGFELPTVNIGDRQLGRTRAANVIDCAADADAIEAAIRQALDPAFRASLAGMANPYGDGNAAERIVTTLRDVPIDARLTGKIFVDR